MFLFTLCFGGDPDDLILHYLWVRNLPKFHKWKGRVTILVSGIITFCLIFAAVLTFAIGIVEKSEFDQLFGEEEVNGLKYKWV